MEKDSRLLGMVEQQDPIQGTKQTKKRKRKGRHSPPL
jgi:hypothetical protein